MIQAFTSIIVIILSLSVNASSDLLQYWKSVSIETAGGESVEIKTKPDSWEIESFRAYIYGKQSELDSLWFSNMPIVDLNTIRLFTSCGFHYLVDEDDWSGSCSTSVRMKLLDESTEEPLPEWYERPEVTYVFHSGVLAYREIKRKVSNDEWDKEFMDADEIDTDAENVK